MDSETASASSTSQAESTEKVEMLKKAADLMAKGKRNMVCNEVPKAVSLFEEAVKILVDSCGELSRDCADAYFSCGSALLELGRMENTVLGAALEGVEVKEENDEDGSEQFEKPPAEDGEEEEGEEGTEDTADDETTAEEGETTAEEGETSQDEHKGDDVGNFQLAWEYLDVAKVIYLKNECKEDQLKAAECHVKLGEISMETEQHTTAAEDLESALGIQEKHLDKEDRVIAETHYTLGLAYGLAKDYAPSIRHYQSAVAIIEGRIATLTKFVEDKDVDAENKENKEQDTFQKHKEEIKDLRDLVPEMKDKIEETKMEQRDLEKMKEMAKEMLGLGGASSSSSTTLGFGPSSSSSSKAAGDAGSSGTVDCKAEQTKPSDIGAHLIRKKRKTDEVVTEIEAKKVCKDSPKPKAEGAKTGSQDGEKMNGHAEVKKAS